MAEIARFFGTKFADVNNRISSYRYLQEFMERAHKDWTRPPNTEAVVAELRQEFKTFSNLDFAFLINHTGYIPETYPPDSSQETLYSKLVEAVVLEWAIRMDFPSSYLPSQKASMEDVAISDVENIIVCDSKSFRLGRSQAAPNVKDVLKHADIGKWLSAHGSLNQLGGLVTFPSQHDWKKGSDFYQYTTDASLPTIALYYEHLSYFLASSTPKTKLINAFLNYGDIFPVPRKKNENNRDYYYSKIINDLFGDQRIQFDEFMGTATALVKEVVFYWESELSEHIKKTESAIREKFEKVTDIELLRAHVVKSEVLRQTEDLSKQQDRIKRFRDSSKRFLTN